MALCPGNFLQTGSGIQRLDQVKAPSLWSCVFPSGGSLWPVVSFCDVSITNVQYPDPLIPWGLQNCDIPILSIAF